MGKRYQVSSGIVIRRRALPSGDVVATLLSQHGKWRAVARKGRLPGGNLGRLSLFHDVTVQYYRRSDEDLALLTQIQLNGALPRLADPAVYPYAHVLAELADSLTVDVHLGEAFHDYLASGLRGLGSHDDPEKVALIYAWKLLQHAGLAPRVARCGVCGGGEGLERLDIAAGSLVCGGCGAGVPLGSDTAEELRVILARTVREALALPLADRRRQWRTLDRYLAFHASELRSIPRDPVFPEAAGA